MSLVDNFMTDTVEIKRFAVGSYVKGQYQRGNIEKIEGVICSIQPIKGRELMNLPEAQRTKEGVKLYTNIELFTADDVNNKKADRFEYNNQEWEIQKVERWVNTDIEYFKSLAVKVDSFEGDRI